MTFLADKTSWGGRAAVGHVTKLSALPFAEFGILANMLASAGVSVTALPATDLFLMGREFDYNPPRGVTQMHRLLAHGVNCSISTNNVLNPFTPFGDCSLIRMANLYANVAQIGTPAAMASCLDMVTSHSANLLNLGDYGIAVGKPADLVVLDCESRSKAVAEIAPALFGLNAGRRVFTQPAAQLHRPD